MKRQKPRGLRLPSTRLLALVFLFCSLLALVITIYREFLIVEPVREALTLQTDAFVICVPSGNYRLLEKRIPLKTGISDRAKADLIITELGKEKAIPGAVTLSDFTVDDNGTLYLNLSKEIRDKAFTSVGEIMAAYSIVNSFLATFKGVTKVQILAENRPVQTLNGVMYTYIPLEFNKDLMEE